MTANLGELLLLIQNPRGSQRETTPLFFPGLHGNYQMKKEKESVESHVMDKYGIK